MGIEEIKRGCIFEAKTFCAFAEGIEIAEYWHKMTTEGSTPCGKEALVFQDLYGGSAWSGYERDKNGRLTEEGWREREAGRVTSIPDETQQIILTAIDEKVRPLLQAHGVDIYYVVSNEGLNQEEYVIRAGITRTCTRCAMGGHVLQSAIRKVLGNILDKNTLKNIKIDQISSNSYELVS